MVWIVLHCIALDSTGWHFSLTPLFPPRLTLSRGIFCTVDFVPASQSPMMLALSLACLRPRVKKMKCAEEEEGPSGCPPWFSKCVMDGI